jgi:hypothetical protein
LRIVEHLRRIANDPNHPLADDRPLKETIIHHVIDFYNSLDAPAGDAANDAVWQSILRKIHGLALQRAQKERRREANDDDAWEAYLAVMAQDGVFLDGQIFLPVIPDLLQRSIIVHAVGAQLADPNGQRIVIGYKHGASKTPLCENENIPCTRWGIDPLKRPLEILYYMKQSASHYMSVTKKHSCAISKCNAIDKHWDCKRIVARSEIYGSDHDDDPNSSDIEPSDGAGPVEPDFTTVSRNRKAKHSERDPKGLLPLPAHPLPRKPGSFMSSIEKFAKKLPSLRPKPKSSGLTFNKFTPLQNLFSTQTDDIGSEPDASATDDQRQSRRKSEHHARRKEKDTGREGGMSLFTPPPSLPTDSPPKQQRMRAQRGGQLGKLGTTVPET